jgi:hypothetical protein
MAESGGDLWRRTGRGSVGREKMGRSYGAHMSVTKEEQRHNGRMCKPEGKTPFGENAKAFRAG